MWLGRGGPASAAGLSRRVRMLPTVPDLPCLRRRLQRYQIGERYYPDWAPVLVHHRQAGSPQLGHPFRDIGDALVSKAIKHVTAQRLTYSDLLRIATLCDNPRRNIAARDHADQAVILNTGRCVFSGEASEIRNNEELVAQNLGVFHAH